jgi:outer membrane lipoprotein-sorting protein
MDRRAFLAITMALPLLAARPAGAQGVDVGPINTYLQRLRGASGQFTQTNPDGSRQTGRFYLAKPGRIRFEYDSPPGAMVISDGNWVGVFDPKSNRNPTRYPLGNTPLKLLLSDDVSLAQPGLVLGATRDAGGTHITVVDPQNPGDGRLVMTFSENPIALRRWEVVTRTGQRTRVDLTSFQQGGSFERSLFNIELATSRYR